MFTFVPKEKIKLTEELKTMPIYKRKEFCELYNVSTQYISVNVKRGNLVLSGKYIDTEVYENKEWIKNWKFKNGIEEESPSKSFLPDYLYTPEPPEKPKKVIVRKASSHGRSESIIPPPKRNPPKDIVLPEVGSGSIDVANMSRTELDVVHKKINIKKAQEDLELAIIKKEKLLGMVIPTDLVFGVFARHFKSVTDSFYQASDNMLIELIPDRKDLSSARAKLVEIVNGAVDDARKNSKKEINALLDEYSESKGRGEKN